MASVGPLEAWWSKKARMSARRRHRVRPSWAISSSRRARRGGSIDQPGHRVLPAAAVRVSVGGDDLLIDHIGDLDGEVFLGVEHAGQAVVLAGGKQLDAGAGDALDPIQRIPGAPAADEGQVLDALADQVKRGAGQGHDVKRVMPISA